MFGLLTLASTVLEGDRISLMMMRHRSRISGHLLVDGHWDHHIDQSCLGVFDCKGPKAVGKEVDLELVEGCARTF